MEDYSIVHGARTAATSTAIAKGACVLRNNSGEYIVSTAANRALFPGRKTTGLAKTAADGLQVRSFDFQFVGIIDKTFCPGVGAGTEGQSVHVDANGQLARGTGAESDVVGYALSDGSAVVLFAGLFGGGGGGASSAGTVGQVQTSNGSGGFSATAHGAVGSVLRQTGATTSAFGQLDLADSDAITGLLPLANFTPGTNGHFLTTTGGVPAWTSISSGAPVGAQYVTVAVDATLTSERVLTGGTRITLADGGAGGNITINWTSPTGTGIAVVTSGALDGAASLGGANTVMTSTGSALSWTTITNAMVNASAAIASSKLAPPGATTQVIYNSAGAFAAHSGFTYDGAGAAVLSVRLEVPLVRRSATLVALATSATDCHLGGDASYANQFSNIRIYAATGGTVVLGTSTANKVEVDTNNMNLYVALGGSVGGAWPFRFQTISFDDGAASTAHTLTASQYACPLISLTSSFVSSKDIIFPNVNGAVWRVKTPNARQLKVSGQPGVTLAANKARWVMCNGTDIEFMEVP